MAAKTALNTKNLEALGATRLAELLIEISAGSAPAKRRLRLELASATGTGELGKQIRKRLTTLARSRSFADWQGIKALAHDLNTQRHAIVDAPSSSVVICRLQFRSDRKLCDRLTRASRPTPTHAIPNLVNGDLPGERGSHRTWRTASRKLSKGPEWSITARVACPHEAPQWLEASIQSRVGE